MHVIRAEGDFPARYNKSAAGNPHCLVKSAVFPSIPGRRFE